MKKILIIVVLINLAAIAGAIAGQASEPPAFRCPFDSFESYPITSAFDLDPGASQADWTGWSSGDPTSGFGHAYNGHTGTDWGLPTGTNLVSVAKGTVTALREGVPNDDHSDTGNYLILSHTVSGKNWQSKYWHLSQNSVIPTVGAIVTKGQSIAQSDNTGNSTGPHLHFALSCTSASGNDSCPIYHGWFEEHEWYYGNTRPCLIYLKSNTDSLNCRRGNSTSYDIVTQVAEGAMFVCSQHNNWYRIFAPMPPARAYESRQNSGLPAAGYTESGTWANGADKSSVADAAGDANYVALAGAGSRYSTFAATGDSDSATFTWTAPQRGNYSIYATWPSNANAKNVTYRVTDLNGSQDIKITQKGNYGQGGTGTHANPYIIETNPYVANHTTVGGDDIWNSYSPEGAGLPENGPERIYKFTIETATSLNVEVAHTGYPTKDVDIHLLYSLSNTDCQARSDWELSVSSLPPGTYYIAIDSYGTDNSGATDYTITVTFGESEPFANKWVKIGDFTYANGGTGTVQILESSVDGKVNSSLEGRVYADAIKVVPTITYRSVWASDAYLTRVNSSTTPLACVGILADQTPGNDSSDINQYKEVPIYADKAAGAANTSAIVGKAVTGQRFVCSQKSGDWYKIYLTAGCGAPEGWIYGDNLFIYNSAVVPVELSVFSAD